MLKKITLINASAEIGTLNEFGSMTLVEKFATGEFDDGTKFTIVRVVGSMNFEIRKDGCEKSMRVNIIDILHDALHVFMKELKPTNQPAPQP